MVLGLEEGEGGLPRVQEISVINEMELKRQKFIDTSCFDTAWL